MYASFIQTLFLLLEAEESSLFYRMFCMDPRLKEGGGGGSGQH